MFHRRSTCHIPRRYKAFRRCAIDCEFRDLLRFLILSRKERINIDVFRNLAYHRELSLCVASRPICTCKPSHRRRICAPWCSADCQLRASLESTLLDRSGTNGYAPLGYVNLRDWDFVKFST